MKKNILMNHRGALALCAALLAVPAVTSMPPAASDGSEWELIWSDEFDGNAMDTAKWDYHNRGGATWSRFIADGDAARREVNRFGDGFYTPLCVKTPPSMAEGNKEMISGAINSKGKFQMRGGYVEARCRTNPHTGNFPAFWLLPVDGTGGWPVCGEIDAWEQIDDEQVAYQTLHHAMRYPKHPNSAKYFTPVSVDSTYIGCETPDVDASQWHVYAVEWDAEHLSFFVDGKLTTTINNPHFAEGAWTEDVTWPFDKDFYVILNQSVGNGSWAKDADPDFTYRTDFDYVRAYQKKGHTDYFTTAKGRITSK